MDFVVLRCGCGSLLWHFSAGSGKFSGLVLEPRDPETQLDDVVRCLLLVLLLPLLLLVVGSCSCGNVIELSATTSFRVIFLSPPLPLPWLRCVLLLLLLLRSERYANAGAARYFGIHKIL